MGDSEFAENEYLKIYSNKKIDHEFRDLALILSTINTVGTKNTTDTRKKIKELTLPENPWRHSAKELLGLMEYLSGQHQTAKKLFSELADDVTTPMGIRSRSSEMLAIIKD